ncbi:MAG: class I SAM-dependent methyltransferase [Vicinamibacterales bacterium]
MRHDDVWDVASSGRSTSAVDHWLMGRLRAGMGDAPWRITLWDGTTSNPPGPATASLLVHDRRTLAQLCLAPDTAFGEAFMRGAVEVTGADLGDALTALYEGLQTARPARGRWVTRARAALRRALGRVNTPERAWSNVHRHYDLGNAFYAGWLDEQLVYTCAFYAEPWLSLEEAQQAKMELVCRKLRLQPGDRVIEAGCGWGALARYMARHHGATVRAFNVSGEQVRYARAAAAREGLSDRVEFIERDYRAIDGACDVFVSIGMLEHVGAPQLGAFGGVVDRVLVRRNGRGLVHFIGRDAPAPLSPWIRRRIFPGAYPPALYEVIAEVLAPHGLSVTDVENLRPHYARTLADWRTRFDRAAGDIGRMFDESFVRAWRLYLAGSEAGFRTGSLQLFQVAFTRAGSPDVPWTRRNQQDVLAAGSRERAAW